MNQAIKKNFFVFAPPAILVIALLVPPWVNPLWAFQDPIVAAQSSGECCSAYFGVMSNIGVIYWIVGATAAACAAIVLRASGAPSRTVAFMTSAGLLTAALGLDDLLLLHERILPKLGIPQKAILLAYALAGVAYVAAFFRDIRSRDFSVLCLGILALVVSLGIDVVFSEQTDQMKIAEDIAKFFGIAGWTGFHWLRAIAEMRERARSTA
ncbi:hypothetical protein BD830_101216 [Maritimibacter alkaliphilus HTCC2654]|uniref:hypothetical protein n=1 Tax=Maritimibacter alkaliphilus TaxID=404236 RepID=UPI0002F18A9B|nr:hypothetical protein [Maritimibacter alkaliphilus]TYP85257.1 hypothetical protein BD830_101216 [Maritimibacter alkaliphilus HTCC2654]